MTKAPFTTLAAACGFIAASASAQTADGEPPLLVTADSLVYDQTGQIITATGDVELIRLDRVLFADSVTYNRERERVAAQGDVALIGLDGEVLFGDYAEFSSDFQNGFVEGVGYLFADDSRAAAIRAERADGRVTTLDNAVYSPCELCEDDPTKPPLWQIKASKVVHDAETKDVVYYDARMEIGGVPVFYAPYFSHPDPSVERRTGFLPPRAGVSTELGPFVTGRYYIDVAPDRDLTLEALASGAGAHLAGAEWRQRFDSGALTLKGAVALKDGEAGRDDANDVWGYAAGAGEFRLDENWIAGFDFIRASDPNFLRVYDIDDSDVLISRAYAHGFFERDFAEATAISFQDLRPGLRNDEPAVLPLLSYSALGEPGEAFGGRWSFDGGVLGLHRSDGPDTRRVALEPGWRGRWISDQGFVATASASALFAGYWVEDAPAGGGPLDPGGDDQAFRFFPSAQVMTSWPLAAQMGDVSHVVEPMAALTLAPEVGVDDEFPNEDSRDLEFDDTNLFARNPYPGVDRVLGGVRFAYGAQWTAYGTDGGTVGVFLGQSVRLDDADELPELSGLRDATSDVVGRIEASPADWLDLDYRFRIDPDHWEMRRSDFIVSAGVPVFRGFAEYTFIDEPPSSRFFDEREEVSFGASSRFAEHWTANFRTRRKLGRDPGSLKTSLGLAYADECFGLSLTATRSYLDRDEVKSGDTVMLRVTFKNLGSVETGEIAREDLFGAGGTDN